MARELKLQDPGEGIHEVEIREVLVAEGDTVGEGDPVLVVESDKAAIEIPAPYSGTVRSIDVAKGDTASVGDVLMTFGEEDETAEPDAEAEETGSEEGEEPAAEETKETGPEDEEEPEEEEEPEGQAPKAKPPKDGGTEAEESQDRAEEPRATDRSATDEDAEEDENAEEVVAASPLARRVAEQQDIDLEAVDATGPRGRVLLEDVEKAADATPAEKRKRRPDDGDRDASPDFAEWGPIERQKLPSIRRATARRMTRAWSNIPHVTHQDSVDITALEAFRRRHAAEVEAQGGKLTLTAFAMKAAVAALREHPWFNASLDAEADEVVLKQYFHLGVAVDTPHGLLVPVIRDVDRKSLLDLAVELTEVAERARSGRLDREALQGGSFTVTNVGPLGGTGFAPIINHPEVAILGLARAGWQPVVEHAPTAEVGPDGEAAIVPRLMLPLCLAFDHRVVDGAAAARFTRRIARTLADVETMTLVG